MEPVNHLYVKLTSYAWTGNVSGVLYVGWKNQSDLRSWLKKTYLNCPKLLSRYTNQDLVDVYAELYQGKNNHPHNGRTYGQYLTKKQYLSETHQTAKKEA